MSETDRLEQEWIRSLVCEAERDLVFLWHIVAAKFDGPTYPSEMLPLVIARVRNVSMNLKHLSKSMRV